MKTILAEKPSVARTIAAVVGAYQRKDGYLEGNGYQVTWALGHLVGLSMPEAYGFKNWSLDHLPLIPQSFKLQVADDPGIKKQFKVIQSLFQNTNEIIVATDAGREGELIFRHIHQLAQPPKQMPIKRLWISDLTAATIRKGLSELRPISEFDCLYFAAKARSEADWLVGINFTQGYTVASAKDKPLSIGRVQTATLRLIVDRYLEHLGFQSKPFYVPRINLKHSTEPFTLSCETKFQDKTEAERLLDGLVGQTVAILKEDKEVKEKPPLLYDLTTLQRTANKVHGFTAQQTLDAAQALYEKHKLISYPRTDSRYLAANQKEAVSKVFSSLPSLECNGVQTNTLTIVCIANIAENPVFNDGKISDHHAIIPTGTSIDLGVLGAIEKSVFLLIVQRFYQSFLSDCIKAQRKLIADIQDHTFSASCSQITTKGWRLLSPATDQEITLLDIPKDRKIPILEGFIHEGVTKPKPLFTESSLLGAMETAGQFVSDKSLRESLKERGLGTPATRASIIETLIKRVYINREKSKLIPSEIGIALIESLRNLSVASPELTGEWEYQLKRLERNELAYEAFMDNITSYVQETFPQVVAAAQKVAQLQTQEEQLRNQSFGPCPKCQTGDIRKGKKSFYCSHWNQDPKCDFTVWMSHCNKKLTDVQVVQLISTGETKKLKGFKSKAGKAFEAKLILDEAHKVKLSFNK